MTFITKYIQVIEHGKSVYLLSFCVCHVIVSPVFKKPEAHITQALVSGKKNIPRYWYL